MLISIANFLHNYQPQPIIFRLGFIAIHWYGLLISLAILIGFWLTLKLAKIYCLDKTIIWNLLAPLIILGFLGARLYHVLSEVNYYLQRPWEIFYFWQGGFGIFGLIIAGVLVVYFYSRKKNISPYLLVAALAPPLALGEAIGRWGNWFNQENFGLPTIARWSIPIDFVNRPALYSNYIFFHPTFLYQSIWNLMVFIFLILLFYFLARSLLVKSESHAKIIIGSYFILYSFGRFFIEFLRVNYQPIIFGLRLAQVVSILMFVLGCWMILSVKISKFQNRY